MNELAGKVRAAIPILGMGISLYWCFTYSGPYRDLAEFQLKHFGSYTPKITLIILCLLFFLIGEVARALLRGAERPVPGVSPRPTSSTLPPSQKRASTLSTYRSLLIRAVPPLLILAVLFVMGSYRFMEGVSAGQLRELQIADFTGSTLPSRTLFAEVHAYPDHSYLSSKNYCYVPLRESSNDSAPVQVILGVGDINTLHNLPHDPDGAVTARGMLGYNINNQIRYTFEKHGITLADPCRILNTGRNPASDEKMGAVLVLVSIVIAGLWALRLSSKNAKAAPVQATVRSNART